MLLYKYFEPYQLIAQHRQVKLQGMRQAIAVQHPPQQYENDADIKQITSFPQPHNTTFFYLSARFPDTLGFLMCDYNQL